MACPYFMPLERLENGNWPHPARLPLGGGWRGHCTAAGHEGEVPPQHVLEAFCNLGYADPCAWAPLERTWDAVRFGVSFAPSAGSADRAVGESPGNHDSEGGTSDLRTIYLCYVCERNHLPVEHGSLQFDLSQMIWLQRHGDPRVQKMAECFLDSYLKKRV